MTRGPRSARVRWLVLAMVLVLVPPSLAQEPRARPTFVVYHVSPDPQAGGPDADPDSIPGVAPDPPFPLGAPPATRVDDSLLADPAPEGAPESAPARFRELQSLGKVREATGSPITLDASGAPDAVRVVASGEGGRIELHAVVIDGALARAVLAPYELNLTAGPANATFSFTLPNGSRADRVGLAIWARLLEPVGTLDAGEVAQSLVWHPGGTARAAQKQPLVEHVTASWCEACKPADDAVGLMASDSAVADGSASGYWRAPGILTALGIIVGLAAAWGLTRR